MNSRSAADQVLGQFPHVRLRFNVTSQTLFSLGPLSLSPCPVMSRFLACQLPVRTLWHVLRGGGLDAYYPDSRCRARRFA